MSHEEPVAETSVGEEATARNFPCESCGADLTFHIGAQSLKCPYCGFVKELAPENKPVTENDFREMARRMIRLRDQGRADEEGLSEVNCAACGGTVRFAGTLTSDACAYCGAPWQLDNVHEAEHRVPVDGILPFRISRDNARSNLQDWVKSLWFAPGDFKKKGIEGKFSGVYLPYWTFDSMTGTVYSGMRGEHYIVTVGSGKNRRTVVKTRWYPASGSFQRFFDDVPVVAGTGLPLERLDQLEPWPFREVEPFQRELLAGFIARTYDVELDQGFLEARHKIDQLLEADVRRRIGGDVQTIHSINTKYDAITYKHLLLPVWMMTYRYREKPYQVVINACTGEVQGDRPWSVWKILFAVLSVLGAVGLVALLMGLRN